MMVAIHYGLGRHIYYVPPASQTKVFKLLFVFDIVGVWASSLARISVAAMLLRFQISNAWRVVLWVLIFIQLAMALAVDIGVFTFCRPLRAMWENVPDAVCWTLQHIRILGYTHAG
jgi:hypothetical protein